MNINIENHYFVLTFRIVHKRLTCTMSPLSSFFSSFQSPVLRVVHAVSSSFCPIFFHSLSWKKSHVSFSVETTEFLFQESLCTVCTTNLFKWPGVRSDILRRCNINELLALGEKNNKTSNRTSGHD